MTYNPLKILFIGTVEFSYYSLKLLIENGFDICGVITKKQSKFNADFKDLTPLCEENKIPIYFDESANKETKEDFIKLHNPDVTYCFGWSYLLSASILNITKYGVIGFHPALLPNNRGRHPIIWALFLGLNKTGSTFFKMDEGADTGDIISQKEVIILESDDALSLYTKIQSVALNQILEFTNELQTNGRFLSIKPQDKNEGNSWRKRGKIDGRIDFRFNTQTIINLVKSLTKPYVGAHVETINEEVKIWKVEVSKKQYPNNIEPGKILEIIDGTKLVVKTYDNAIVLIEHDFKIIPKVNEYL